MKNIHKRSENLINKKLQKIANKKVSIPKDITAAIKADVETELLENLQYHVGDTVAHYLSKHPDVDWGDIKSVEKYGDAIHDAVWKEIIRKLNIK